MEDSEKRGRGIVARRQQQQQQQQSLVTPMAAPPSSPQRKSRRKMTDFMLGVAAGLNARKNNGAVQTTASNIPRHFDFSYRDRNDVTAKRRFQVKVPFRLLLILALVFLLIPGMIFIHKELHIHDDHYVSHYKGENYVNVNTKDVWDNFKLATTTDDAKGMEINTTIVVKHQAHPSHSEDHALQQNHTVVESAVAKNETKPIVESTEDEESDEANEEDDGASDDESSPEEGDPETVEGEEEEDHDGSPSAENSLVEGNDNKLEEDAKNLATTTNSTASKNPSDR